MKKFFSAKWSIRQYFLGPQNTLPQDPEAQASMVKDYEKQLTDSESNLKAQYEVLMQQQEV